MSTPADTAVLGGQTEATKGQARAYLAATPGCKLSAAEITEIVDTVWALGLKLGIRPDMALAQQCHETARFTFPGQVPFAAKNVAGIGAVNDGRSYLTYPTWAAGVLAYFVHLVAWLGGPLVVPAIRPDYTLANDPRYPLVAAAITEKGPATTWASLGGRWAVPRDVPWQQAGPGYGLGIARHLAAILTLTITTPLPERAPMQYATRTHLIPKTNTNRPGDKLVRLTYVVVHETDNEQPGATAAMHEGYVINSDPEASFTFVADADESIQLLPLDEVCWAIGDGADQPGHDASYESVSIEICVNDRSRQMDAYRRAADVIARVLFDKGLPLSAVRQHGSFWSQENQEVHRGCPKHLQAGDWGQNWAGFLTMVGTRLLALGLTAKTPATPSGPDAISVALTTRYLALPADLQGSLANDRYYEATMDFSGLYAAIQGPQRGIVGEYVAFWYGPSGAVMPLFPQDRVTLLAAGKITRR